MAEIKISDLTPKGANLIATDLLVISEDIGGGLYETKSITGDEVLNAVAKTAVAVRNQTGATIYKGTIVYISGTSGGKALISKARADAEITSSKTLGVVTADIANNANGNVLTNGLLTDLDTRTTATNPFTTDTLVIGDDLYLSPTTAGYVTNVKPIAPNNLVSIGKVLETSGTTGQILYAIVNGYELGELHDVDTTGAVTGNVLALDGGIWKPTTISSGGVFGISNSSGVYTYYSTLTLAMAAATSGQTIEMFTSVTETEAVQINLKNGVNINFNGHTYTLNSAGTQNAFSDNNVAVTCKLTNGIVNRMGGTNTGSNSFCLDMINASTNIDADGMKFISSFSTACRLFDGNLSGGYYSGYTIGLSITSGIAHNINSHGQTSYGININGGELSNSKTLSNGSYGILLNGGIVSNCYAKSTANSGCLTQGGVINNSTFVSTSNSGLWIYSGSPVINQCLGYSTAGVGIQLETTARVTNCNGYSTVNKGINVSLNTPIYNCVSESLANVAMSSVGGVYGCTAKSYWNNASGHAMSSTNPEVFNCHLEVTNASANCLHFGSAINVKFGANIFKGATNQVNANITQTQANSPDTYGNIKIG